MKLTIALFLGVISASQLEDLQDEVNALKIHATKKGLAEIEKEFGDIEHTIMKVKDSRPVRNLKNSIEKFAMTKEIANIKKIDKAFLASPEGKKLVHEWMDVGHVLDEYATHDGVGYHFPNEHMYELSDELSDVAHEYEKLEGSKWDKAYEAGWKAAFDSKHGKQFVRRVKTFDESAEGQAIHKEVVEFGDSVKKNIKVTELPDHWKDEADLLKLHVSPAGQKAIEKEFNDVGATFKKVKMARSVRNMGNSLERWGKSDEVKAIKALDKKFLASPEGKELMAEWKDFGMALKEHVKKTKTGIHIDHDGMQIIEDEMDDIEHEYKMLHGSKWEKLYDAAWKKATTSHEAKSVGRRFEHFAKSNEWKMLEKELKELDLALKTHVKITDVPKDLQDEVAFLKVTVSKEGQAAIEKEFADIGHTMKAVKMRKSVRNFKNSMEKFVRSPEFADFKEFNASFWKSPEGQELAAEIKDFHDSLKEHIKPTTDGFHIDDEGMQIIEDEADDVEHEMKMLKDSHWDQKYAEHMKTLHDSKAG